MTECPGVPDDGCNFMPGSKCFHLRRDQKSGLLKPCENCNTVIAYWRKRILEVFHNPVCLIECEVRTGASCTYTRGEECPMIMTPNKQGMEERAK